LSEFKGVQREVGMRPQDVISEYKEAIASQDWSNVEKLMHEDVSVTFSTGTHIGKPEVQRAYERNFAAIDSEEYAMDDLTWVYLGDECAVCLFTST
jgi:ketosteroid isomerase-like protein